MRATENNLDSGNDAGTSHSKASSHRSYWGQRICPFSRPPAELARYRIYCTAYRVTPENVFFYPHRSLTHRSSAKIYDSLPRLQHISSTSVLSRNGSLSVSCMHIFQKEQYVLPVQLREGPSEEKQEMRSQIDYHPKKVHIGRHPKRKTLSCTRQLINNHERTSLDWYTGVKRKRTEQTPERISC